LAEYTYQNRPIPQWAEDDRPREKLLEKGRLSLSDAELLAILIGSGSREESAVGLCKRLVADYGNNLYELGKASVVDLMKYKGIGEAKAISIVAALELSRRRKENTPTKKHVINSSQQVFEIFSPLLSDINVEEFWVLYLNRGNKILGKECLSRGGLTGAVADGRLMFKSAIEKMATGVIMVHNHPSGQNRPSDADVQLTRRLIKAGGYLDIKILDHMIIAENQFFSFADERML
jgi:DNA repair protein RadC